MICRSPCYPSLQKSRDPLIIFSVNLKKNVFLKRMLGYSHATTRRSVCIKKPDVTFHLHGMSRKGRYFFFIFE